MANLFDNLKYFLNRKDIGNEKWEDFYRHRWQHDKEVRSTHGVNCTGSCSWRIFVKKGIVTWEMQQTDYPDTRAGLPNHEPRGCPRGASYSWYLYNSGRVKHPMIRKEMLDLYEEAKKTHKDSVEAWASIANDKAKKETYKKVRGLGGFVRLDWDTALEIMAAANIYTIKKYGPDRLVGFTPIPAFSMLSYAAGTRYLSLLGGACLSFYDFYCDLPPASPQTWGEQTDVPESADWYNASFLLLWGSNVPVTRTPDSAFYTQVRYKGTQVAVISPDYSDASKFADVWMAPKQGTDSALGMAMGHVILKEFYQDKTTAYFDEYVKKFTDLPYLVKLRDAGNGRYVPEMMLRASDLPNDFGIEKKAEWYPITMDDETGKLVSPNGSIGSRWNNEGKWNLKNEDVRTGQPFTPCLSQLGKEDEIVTIMEPYFGGEDFKNPNFAATGHPDIIEHKIPVVKIETKEGTTLCANVFDLMMAHYGIDRGLGDENCAKDYGEDKPFTPKWQEQITGVPAERIIQTARAFAETAEKTKGKSMIIIGAGVNQWYNTDMTYRSAINMLMLCGTLGVNGGGWSHYVGQEKVRPQAGWANIAFALDWIRPPRHMNTVSYVYMHSDQWRYEKVTVDEQLSPLTDKDKWKDLTLLDCNIKSQRMGWLPAEPEFNRSSLQLCKEAKAAGVDVKQYVCQQLHENKLTLASEDLDAEENSPKNLFIWRANLIGCSAKGMEYFMKHLLGAQNSILGQNLEECGMTLPKYEKWHTEETTGKLDLVVNIDYRMTQSSIFADIVLPAATWYEKEDISSTDMHPFLHPFSKAVDPVWESRTDWNIFRDLAAKFSVLCQGHLGAEQDIVYGPLSHDSAGEISEPLVAEDWKETGAMPEPGKNMGNLVPVIRDYPNTYKRFTAVGPLLRDKGIAAKGMAWSSLEEYNELKAYNGVVREEGVTKGMPDMTDIIQGIDTVLTLDPTSNGAASKRAWKALEKSVGLPLAEPLTKDAGETQYHYKDLVVQPRLSLSTPIWTGINNKDTEYTGNYTNVQYLIPWRTVTGRQSFYQDHPWMQAFGENLVTYKPPLAKKEINNLKERLGLKDKTLSLNLLTPHNKWTIHSSWNDNLLMLTLGRGGPVIWMSELDAAKLEIKDNDWVEVINDNGSAMCRACVSQRIPEGALYMYHNQGRTVNVPISPLTGKRGGIHNSISRLCPKPTHMIGGYAQLSFGLNYYGTIGANRDEFVMLRKVDDVKWD
ncbi:MAG: nitrate reductase subunit alpha [Bacteroidaceae bacterium]|nr:nitrate reductase subunit alpha [Bacteroidaceae bacterium]